MVSRKDQESVNNNLLGTGKLQKAAGSIDGAIDNARGAAKVLEPLLGIKIPRFAKGGVAKGKKGSKPPKMRKRRR